MCSSPQGVIRGSSIPNLSGCDSTSGSSRRSGSTIQFVRPSALRATQRWERARAVFDADEQEGLAAEPGDAGIEDRVDRVWPLGRGENRIPLVASEELRGHQVTTSNIRSLL